MQRLLDFFGSVRLTLALLMILAVVAIGGTLQPVEQVLGEGPPVKRFDLYFQSPWYRLLLLLLAINLAVCTWRTLRRTLGERQRLAAQIKAGLSAGSAGHELPAATVEQLTARLGAAGYRVTPGGAGLLGQSRAYSRWAVPVLHLSVILIMIGALAGALGFVGTVNLYVTHQIDSVFDWESQGQRPLEFTFRLDHFEPTYYPIDLQIAVVDPQQMKLLQTITTREGETVEAGNGLSMRVLRFYPEEEHLVLFLERNGRPIGEYHALSGKRDYPNNPDPGVLIKPAAFRDPRVKQLSSQVTILENGQEVRQAVIEVNSPLVHRGVAIYQTAYSRDPNGFWYCGFQFSRDPGEPLVWGGSIVLTLALLVVFTLRPCNVAVVPRDHGWRLVALGGFRGEIGRQKLEALAAALTGASAGKG
ncbi:MAG: cytochrome c biogenesis protein ResB [Desulfuromonadales bacterium]|nr:cytochrome c biogenesis protein ResB [Desulfuromonadales bacterium]